MQRFIPPVADFLAWALMGNHFHFVVRIKEPRVYKFGLKLKASNLSSNANGSPILVDAVRFEELKWETVANDQSALSGNRSASNGKRSASNGNRSASNGPDRVTATPNQKYATPINHFSHLFNAYAKYFNLRHNRTGSLFQPQFKRNPIDSENYLRQAIIYTHQNPVKHGFVNSPHEYPWTSYHEYTDSETDYEAIKLALDELFGNVKNFIAVHQQITDFEEFEG